MDIENELSKALSDPDIMNKVQGVLSSLNNKEESNEKGATPQLPDNMLSSLGNMAQKAKHCLSFVGKFR